METKYIEVFDKFASDDNKKEKLNPTEVDAEWVMNYLKSGKPFGIVSAFLPDNNTEANTASHEELKRETIRNKYGYREFAFRFSCSQNGTTEKNTHRLLIIPDIPFHTLLSLAEIFGQQSIAIRGDSGLNFIRVADEQLLLSIPVSDVQLAWCNLLLPHGAWGEE